MNELFTKFIKLFDGYEHAYGQHSNFIESENGKVNGRGQTFRKSLKDEIIEHHLNGTGSSLGIIPLKLNNCVRFGVIDLDKHHPTCPLRHTLEEMEDKVNSLSLPLVVCQSKSKDVHLYCFAKEDIDAKLFCKRLREWSVLLGYGNTENFPKQSFHENEIIGNWINMPYFNEKETVRYCINKHKRLNLEEFLEFAEIMKVGKEELQNFKIEDLDESYDDAPPCLQMLYKLRIEEGSRNEGLYNFGVYLKNKYPDSWQDKLIEINVKIISPQLNLKEVEGIIRGLNKKDYYYKCSQYPICQYCNKAECHKRKFGIGRDPEMDFNFDNLTKHISADESVIWFAECGTNKIKLSTEELFNQRLLQIKLAETITRVFQPMKQDVWLYKIKVLFDSCITIIDPNEASRKGQFEELLDSFLTNGVGGDQKRDLIKNNTYLDSKEGIIYFKGTSLYAYLKNKRFKYSEQEIWHWLRGLGANKHQIQIANKRIRVWSINAPEFYDESKDEEKKI